jgi:hypothetical protein
LDAKRVGTVHADPSALASDLPAHRGDPDAIAEFRIDMISVLSNDQWDSVASTVSRLSDRWKCHAVAMPHSIVEDCRSGP